MMTWDIRKHLKKNKTKELLEKQYEIRKDQLRNAREESFQKYKKKIEKDKSYPKQWRGLIK